MPKRILVVTYVPPTVTCGVTTYYRLLQDNLPSHGFEVELVTPSRPSRPTRYLTAILRRLAIATGLVQGSRRILLENVICWIRLRSALRRIAWCPDLIHAQDPGSASAAATVFRNKAPVLTTCHFNDDLTDEALARHRVATSETRYLRRWHAWTFSRTKEWIAVSNYAKGVLQKHIPANSIVRVIHNGVDFRKFATEEPDIGLRARYPGKMLVLTVGELESRKNQILVLDVAEQLRADPVVFLLTGDGPDRSLLEDEIRRRSLAKHVAILGYRKDVQAVMRGCDLYFHSALNENCPFTVIEAIASGLPVIASAAGGIPEILAGTESTCCFAPQTPPEVLADRVRDLLENAELRQEIALKQHDAACREFSLAHMMTHTVAVYREIGPGPLNRAPRVKKQYALPRVSQEADTAYPR